MNGFWWFLVVLGAFLAAFVPSALWVWLSTRKDRKKPPPSPDTEVSK